MIQSHIKNLLYAYDCVIIPDFGGLITHYASAKIHPVKHTFSPPSKRIAFNEQLKVNDGLLISTLAKQQQWPLTQAQQAVTEFVQELKTQLLQQHRFELQDVGVFRYNAERKLVFENIESENFLELSFGLPELVAKPIAGKESLVLRGKYQDQVPGTGKDSKKPVGRFQKLYRIGTSLLIGGLTISAAYLFTLQNNVALSSLNPLTLMSSSETKAPEVTSPVVPEETLAFEQKNQEPLGFAHPHGEDAMVSGSSAENSPETQDPWQEETEVATPNKEATPEKEEVAPAAPAIAEVAKTKKDQPVKVAATGVTIKQKTGRYYVIMGVFTQDGYAERNVKQLKKKGYEAKILQPAHDRDRDRVSVADFATAQEAWAALPALREKINNELWVFNY